MKFSSRFSSKIFRRSFISAAAFLFACIPFAVQADYQAKQADYRINLYDTDTSKCQTFTAGYRTLAGLVCIRPDRDFLEVTYATVDGWELVETNFWIGAGNTPAEAGMPADKQGHPEVGSFLYTSGDITGETEHVFYISLDDAFGKKEICDITGVLTGHALVRKDYGDGNYQTEVGWIDGTPINRNFDWAMFSSINFTCTDR
ncbi:MAG: hypothetical protein D3904_16535 [Candidatus Electrothrix sp. EH2]|nr:hypothetical protein [Candidatus Electrothrix sp. EH2]